MQVRGEYWWKLGAAMGIGLMTITSCGEDPAANEMETDKLDQSGERTMSRDTEFKIEKAQNIIYQIPSPIEMATLIKRSGATFDPTLMNDAGNARSYTTSIEKAINLGVYGADINYANVFQESSDLMVYLSAAKGLSDQLGISNAFNEATMKAIEANIDNRDTMLHIISEAFWMVDAYLKENDRDNISALIITGGWIEGLYIASKLAIKHKDKKGLAERIAEQKHSIDDLIALIGSYQADNNVNEVLVDLNKVKEVFDKVNIESKTGKTTVNKNTGVMTIGGSSKIEISPETLLEISNTVEAIRNKYIKV